MVNSQHRVFGLDLLRALAILMVIYAHGGNIIDAYSFRRIYHLLSFDGVSFFFVLSGFLIGRILLRTVLKETFDGRALLDFWVRRWFRTVPNYVLVLSILVASHVAMELPTANLVRYFTFSQNLTSPHPKFFPEAWSLAVEEWFYLCIPILIYMAAQIPGVDRRRLIVCSITLVIVAVTLFRAYRAYKFGYVSIHEWDINLRKQVITRLDSMMYGVAAAYVSLYHREKWLSSPRALCGLGMGLVLFDRVMISDPTYRNFFGMSVISIGVLCLLPLLSEWERPVDRFSRAVEFVSATSYAMYLLNLSVVQTFVLGAYQRKFTGFATEPIVLYFLYWAITVGGAYLMYEYFERHMTALRDKLPESWRPSTRPVGATPAQ